MAPVSAVVGSARSLLFVPGTRPDRFAKAAGDGADLVVVDLEDAVPEEEKIRARAATATWLGGDGAGAVRVNGVGTAHHDTDLAALAGATGLAAVIVPKAESVDALTAVHERLGPDVTVVPLVETAAGLLRVAELAAVPGVVRVAFGHLDFAVDVDADTGHEAMLMARSTLVVASRAAGLPGPVDGVTAALDAPEAARQDALRARRLGFTGKLCIHPSQVAVANEAMSPSESDVVWARRVLTARTDGVAGVDGEMVDAPVVARAENIMSRVGSDDE